MAFGSLVTLTSAPARAQSTSVVPFCFDLGANWDGATNTCTVDSAIVVTTPFTVTSGTTLVVGSDGTMNLAAGIVIQSGATFDIKNTYCPGGLNLCPMGSTGSIYGVNLLGGSITNYGVVNVEDTGYLSIYSPYTPTA